MRYRQGEMGIRLTYIFILLMLVSFGAAGQTDEDPPVSPVFTFLSVNPVNNVVEMNWTSSPSPDVAGYVVYLFKDGEGYALDTIFNPLATSYTVARPGTNYYSESFVIAAIDLSDNISPLSNQLNTIYAKSMIDTCRNQIDVTWNKYLSIPVRVTGYDVFVSVNSAPYSLAKHISADTTSLIIENIANGSQYCFFIKAALENGFLSGSNRTCSTARIQKTPDWINADFASVTDENKINLEFSIDPLSEIDLFTVERRKGFSGSYQEIARITETNPDHLVYTDATVELNTIYFYRLAAINTCNDKVAYSNEASNMLLSNYTENNEIVLQWNKYRNWLGSVVSYRVYSDMGDGFIELAETSPADTVFNIELAEVMYKTTGGQICLYVGASETGNPFGINGEAVSNKSCTVINETITVPNVFTPDGDLLNDLFKPVITYTPKNYQFVVSDRKGRILFESDDFLESWDGSDKNGEKVREGVYLWFIRLETPSGKNISRSGTVTIVIR